MIIKSFIDSDKIAHESEYIYWFIPNRLFKKTTLLYNKCMGSSPARRFEVSFNVWAFGM